ncbi:response regulator [Thalassotalea sp. PLHSN55]|uniref:response regulator n=1 Tax=Thalassotalea sp. PLHSN55 TaxID=3435888 RepID=UPI003F846F6C
MNSSKNIIGAVLSSKGLMSQIDFTNTKFLIVDSVKQSSATLKNFIQNLGCARVDESSRINEILSLCESFDYDCILLGYDLGQGKKNGQQLLEELRLKKLISRHCIVIMITAELSQEMVLAALEHKPNEYLAKPYTLKDLTTRIDRSFKKIKAMQFIYKALDNNEHKKVIYLCQQKIDDNSPYALECAGIISRQYFQLKQFDQANQIYMNFSKTPNCQWADIGLGKIALHKKNYTDAKKYFETIIKNHPYYLSAYDWLATTHQLENDLLAAEATLAKAIEISPRSYTRMNKYAHICYTNTNYQQATNAYFQTNDLAQNTMHKEPAIAFSLADASLEYSVELPLQQTKALNNRVFKVLSQTSREFTSPEVSIQTGLFNARLHYSVNNIGEYEACLKRAENILERRIDELPVSSMADIANNLFKLDRKVKANNLLFKMEQFKQDNQEFLLEHEDDNLTNLTNTEKQKAQIAVEKAITFYHNELYQQALDSLKEALIIYPNHNGIKINVLQVLLVAFEKDENDELLNKARELIKELKKNKKINEKNQRFIKLKQKFYSLQK